MFLMVVKILIFWVVMPCGLVGKDQCFEGIYCLHLPLKMEAVCSSEILVSTYKSAWHYNSEDQHQQLLSLLNLPFPSFLSILLRSFVVCHDVTEYLHLFCLP
jgi:hypothetical protein